MRVCRMLAWAGVSSWLLVAGTAAAQELSLPQNLPPPQLSPASWYIPAKPAHIAGPIHFVGTHGIASYIIETTKGLILIDGGPPATATHVEASIRERGFDPKNIKKILISHAHIDHAGAVAHFQHLSKATVYVMGRDAPHLESGGKTDPVYGDAPLSYFPKVKKFEKVHDGDTVPLGNITLMARLGAGHSQGATTWIATIKGKNTTYNVVFLCCTGVNPSFGPLKGHQLVGKPSYPDIAGDYKRTFDMLARQKPDIWLAGHTEFFDYWGKQERAKRDGIKAWIDPQGYRDFVKIEKFRFEEKLKRQTEVWEAKQPR